MRPIEIKENQNPQIYHKKSDLTIDEWNTLYDELKMMSNPDINVLKLFLNAPIQKHFPSSNLNARIKHSNYISNLELKLKGLSKTPTTIEKTMTRAQLFQINNPLWTIGVTPNTIQIICATTNKLKNNNKTELIPKFFEETLNNNGYIDHSQYSEFCRKNNI